MGFPRKLGLLLLCAGAVLNTPLTAQRVVSARAGLITYLQGPAFVDGKRVVFRSPRFPQMKNGETLSTSRGRAELLLAPGAVLRLSENSQLVIEDTQLAETRVLLQRGDALIEIVQLPEGNRIQVGLADTITELTRPGLYRFGTAQHTLRVYGGETLVHSGLKTAIGKRGMAVDLDPTLKVSKFDRKQTDSLHAWAARRSFDLFISDSEARRKRNHWVAFGDEYVNKTFDVGFHIRGLRRLPAPTIATIPPADSH